jgi:hypothetical protein
MTLKNLFANLLLIVVLLSASAGNAFAVTTPTFPACANPQGQLKVSYDSGVHGVVGDSNTYSGKDNVYTLSSSAQTQCLCTVEGKGIQTNWWKATELSQDEISILVNQGWIYVPNGSAWGLTDDPYLAMNLGYSCTSTNNNPGGPGDGRSDGRSDGRTESLGIHTSSITQSVLGLASTGNIAFILSVILLGIVFLSSGILASRKSK